MQLSGPGSADGDDAMALQQDLQGKLAQSERHASEVSRKMTKERPLQQNLPMPHQACPAHLHAARRHTHRHTSSSRTCSHSTRLRSSCSLIRWRTLRMSAMRLNRRDPSFQLPAVSHIPASCFLCSPPMLESYARFLWPPPMLAFHLLCSPHATRRGSRRIRNFARCRRRCGLHTRRILHTLPFTASLAHRLLHTRSLCTPPVHPHTISSPAFSLHATS